MKRAFTLIELLIVIAIIAILALIAVPNFLEAQVRAKASRAKADMRSLATAIEAYFVDFNTYPISRYADYEYDRHNYHFYLWFSDPDSLWRNNSLTTPIGYITSFPLDPFPGVYGQPGYFPDHSYFYLNFLGAAQAYNRIGASGWASENGNYFRTIYEPLMAPAPLKFNTGFGSSSGPYNTDTRVYNANWALICGGPDLTYEFYPGANATTIQSLNTDGAWQLALEGGGSFYDPSNGTVSWGDIWRFSSGGTE